MIDERCELADQSLRALGAVVLHGMRHMSRGIDEMVERLCAKVAVGSPPRTETPGGVHADPPSDAAATPCQGRHRTPTLAA